MDSPADRISLLLDSLKSDLVRCMYITPMTWLMVIVRKIRTVTFITKLIIYNK